MKRARMLLVLLVVLLPAAARAFNCTSVTSPGVSINYQTGTLVTVQSVFAVTCTRAAGDPLTLTYSVKANDGLNTNNTKNRAKHASGATLEYDLYTSASCATQWKKNTTISDTITWPAGSTASMTKQTSYWACIVTGQTPSNSGLYADTVDLTVSYGNNGQLPGIVQVSLYAQPVCTVTSPPGNINLSYAAFGPQVAGSASIGVQCTSGMPYVLSTDVPEGVLNGLRYVLSLSAVNPNGTGAPQAHTISATLPAGQAGTCAVGSCSATRTHTLTISY